MITITVTKTLPIDVTALHVDILNAVGSVYQGLSVDGTTVKVFLADNATGTEQDDAEDAATYSPISGSYTEDDIAAAQAAARAALPSVDFTDLRADLDAAGFTTDQRYVLRAILRTVYYNVAAQALSSDDTGA